MKTIHHLVKRVVKALMYKKHSLFLYSRFINFLTFPKTKKARFDISQYEQTAKGFEAIEIKPSSDAVFLLELEKIIEQNISDTQFNVHSLEKTLGMSRSHIHRKLIGVTNMSATEFIRFVRLTKASNLLREDKNKTVSEIAYDVGFTSLSYFTRRFHEKFGVSPTDWREGNKP
jgi:AraC-like DNA-binding protein